MAEGCEGTGFGVSAGFEQLSEGDNSPKRKSVNRKEENLGIETSTGMRFMVPLANPNSITKVKTIFRTISQECSLGREVILMKAGYHRYEDYRISAKECSNAPRFGMGMAPTSLATHAPTRFATSFIKFREAP